MTQKENIYKFKLQTTYNFKTDQFEIDNNRFFKAN